MQLTYDWFSTKQGITDQQVQYTVDGSTWVNIGPLQIAVANGFNNGISIDLSAIGGVNNDPNFGVRMVSAYDPTYHGAGSDLHRRLRRRL